MEFFFRYMFSQPTLVDPTGKREGQTSQATSAKLQDLRSSPDFRHTGKAAHTVVAVIPGNPWIEIAESPPIVEQAIVCLGPAEGEPGKALRVSRAPLAQVMKERSIVRNMEAQPSGGGGELRSVGDHLA